VAVAQLRDGPQRPDGVVRRVGAGLGIDRGGIERLARELRELVRSYLIAAKVFVLGGEWLFADDDDEQAPGVRWIAWRK
jgi:hypothetical protein